MIAAFAVVVAAAHAPNVVEMFSILDTYDVLIFKREHFLFHLETEHLFSVARPLAAMFTQLPILPVQSLDDFRWVRVFSILTACVFGTLLMANFVVRLHLRKLDALAVALAIILIPPFIYAILTATAWMPHLMGAVIAAAAYTLLGRSNVQATSFLITFRRGDYKALVRQILEYARLRQVWGACVVYQLSFYDYPPYAMIAVVFPVVGILFSQAPIGYRMLIALRDTTFVAANIVLYALSTKLAYLPFVRLFTQKGTDNPAAYENEFVAQLYAGHQFKYNTDIGAIISRFEQMLGLSGDIWFLPQMHMGWVTLAILIVAVLLSNLTPWGAGKRATGPAVHEPGAWRLNFHAVPPQGIVTVAVVLAAFAMAAAPVLASVGGFVQYRTSVAAIATVAVLFVFALRSIVETLWCTVGDPGDAAAQAGTAAMVLTVGTAFAANLDMNVSLMKLARNEFIYFSEIVRQAKENGSKTIILIDPRPWGVDTRYVYDEQRRALPSRDELSCFASYCMQTGSIVRVAAASFGFPSDAFEILHPRGDEPVPGLTCEMITRPQAFYPPNASEKSIGIINYYRTLTPLTCVTVDTAWHDLGVDLRRDHVRIKILHSKRNGGGQ